MFYNKIMNDKYYELYKNYKTDFSISEVEPILNFSGSLQNYFNKLYKYLEENIYISKHIDKFTKKSIVFYILFILYEK